jgi:hypothetical protein
LQQNKQAYPRRVDKPLKEGDGLKMLAEESLREEPTDAPSRVTQFHIQLIPNQTGK